MATPEHHDYDGITEDRERRPPVYFTVLFYGLIVWGVVFCAFYLLSGWSSSSEFQVKMQTHADKTKPAAAAPVAAVPAVPAATAAGTPDAKILFADKCAVCHGADAKGGFGPDLTAAKYQYGKTGEAIGTSIAQGRGNGRMPAFAGQLKSAEIQALTDYLLSLK
jgi:cytochrome c oxidase cbb3-type subunit 3